MGYQTISRMCVCGLPLTLTLGVGGLVDGLEIAGGLPPPAKSKRG